MKKNIILFDWDNTIATGIGELREDELRAAIQIKINEGWLIGLNSDTPLKRLRTWWKMLCMNGPIIAEKGAVIWWPGTQEIVISETAGIFGQIRNKIIASLIQQNDVGVFVGDSTRFIRSTMRWDGDENLLVAVDAYRVCSMGLFVRQIRNRKIYNDTDSMNKIHDLMKQIMPFHPLISPVYRNVEHGFISINPLDTDKARGVEELLNRLGDDAHVIMIGDSLSDYVPLPQIIHFAVGNAQDAFKQKSDRVAENFFSQGCIELLKSI